MKEIKEIKRRCELSNNAGIACGPVSVMAICAELEIQEGGKSVYLSCTWCDEASEAVSFEATKESIFDFMIMKNDDMDALDKIRETALEIYSSDDGTYEGEYGEQYNELVQMIKNKLVEEGIYSIEDFEGEEFEF